MQDLDLSAATDVKSYANFKKIYKKYLYQTDITLCKLST